MTSAWWRFVGTPTRRRRRFSLRRWSARPARTLRLHLDPPRPSPARAIDEAKAEPSGVGHLLRSPATAVPETVAVSVLDRPVRAVKPVELPVESPPAHPAAQMPSIAGPSRSEPDGPSLADRLRAVLAVPLESLLPGPGATIEWPGPLLGYQIEGVRVLMERDRVLLADDMGLGKTIQAAAAIRLLCLRHEIERALLVVPASLREQWRRELARWAPELRVIGIHGPPKDRAWQWAAEAHVKIVSYETLRADVTDNSQCAPLRRIWDLVVLDEAQRIKNASVATSRACKRLDRRRSWAMTGTPLENSIADLASILEFVDHVHGEPAPPRRSTSELLARQRDLQLRRRKQDVLTELPPKQVIHLAIPLLDQQQATYDQAEREGIVELKERGARLQVQHVLELILRLKQICNVCPKTGESAKLADIEERLRTLTDEGHRALIFSQFTDERFGVGAVAQYLREFQPLTFTGSMSSAQRIHVIEEFKRSPEHRALILSLHAGGVGLNLQEASYVFHLDRWWNPAVERQAEDRSHRIGQSVPVTVYKYTTQGTIEERIHQIITEKQALFDEVVDDVSIDLGQRLTTEELFGLFGLPVPRQSEASRERAAGRRAGVELEERCAEILRRVGWKVQQMPRSGDGGIDLVAERVDEVGIAHKLLVQCKDHARPVGVEVVRQLLGVLPPGEMARGVIAAPSGLTSDAMALARGRGVIVWDEEALARLESGETPG